MIMIQPVPYFPKADNLSCMSTLQVVNHKWYETTNIKSCLTLSVVPRLSFQPWHGFEIQTMMSPPLWYILVVLLLLYKSLFDISDSSLIFAASGLFPSRITEHRFVTPPPPPPPPHLRFFSFTRAAIIPTNGALLTWYGTLVTTIASLFWRRFSQSSTSECGQVCTTIRPFPVFHISRAPSTPRISPPWGNQGLVGIQRAVCLIFRAPQSAPSGRKQVPNGCVLEILSPWLLLCRNFRS